MHRRRFLLASLAGALAAPLAGEAQLARKMYTVLLPRLAAELVGLKPDVIVVSVTEAALAAKNATSTIPIVMVSVPDPVAAGLVPSLARPGGNITGLSRQTRDLIGKTLQLLREALPGTTRVDLLANPTEPLHSTMVADAKEAAKLLGVQLQIVEARSPVDLEGAFAKMRADRAGAMLVVSGAGFYLNRAQIVRLALRDRLPSVFQNREFVEAGGLSYAPSTAANYHRAAVFLDSRSISGPRRRSGSRSRRHCWRGQIRSLSESQGR